MPKFTVERIESAISKIKNILGVCLLYFYNILIFTKLDIEFNWQRIVKKAYNCFLLIIISSLVIHKIILIIGFNTEVLTRLYRFIMCFSLGIVILLFITLSFCYYYQSFLKKKKPFELRPLIFMFFIAVLLFSFLYLWSYLFSFSMGDEYFEYNKTIMDASKIHKNYNILTSSVTFFDFLIYSTKIMVYSSYWKIRADNVFLSFAEVLQGLYGLFFIVLVFASYIEGKGPRKKE